MLFRYFSRYMAHAVCAACAVLALFAPAPARAAENLSVITMQPQGQVEELSQIVVRFSESMRPLGEMEQEAGTSPLQLNVPGGRLPAGNFRWLDPATLAYLFDAPVNVPLRIEARIPAGITALSGAKLPSPVAFNLRTPRLEMQLIDRGPLPPRDAYIDFQTNYPLDLLQLRQKLRLSCEDNSLSFDLKEEEIWPGMAGRQTGWLYTISIRNELPGDQQIRFKLDSGLNARGGHEPMAEQSFTLKSYTPLQVKRWHGDRWGQGDKGPLMPESRIQIYFNNPVVYGDLLEYVEISPPAPLREEARQPDAQRTAPSFSLPFNWSPRTSYTVKIKAGLPDTYGSAQAKDYVFEFKTGDYQPFFYMDSGVKVLERNLPEQLAGQLPLHVRNMSPIEIQARYLPWNNAGVSRYLNLARARAWPEEKEFRLLAGARLRNESLNFSKRFNTNIAHLLDVPGLLGMEGPEELRGLAELRITTQYTGWDRQKVSNTWDVAVQMTDIGLTFKAGRDSSLAWVTGLSSGEPMVGVPLTLFSDKGEVLWQGSSGANGVALLPGQDRLKSPAKLLMARTGDDACLLSLDFDRLPQAHSDSLAYPDGRRPWNVHMLTQLPLYQPGQTVRFALYARVYTDQGVEPRLEAGDWMPVAGKPLKLTVTDSRGKVVHEQSTVSNAYGSIAGEFELSGEANLGWYNIAVACEGFHSGAYSAGFQVASFRPPDFKVDIAAPESQPVPVPDPLEEVEPMHATLGAEYFSGAPLPDAQVSFTASQESSLFTPAPLRGYKVGPDTNPWWGYGRPGLGRMAVMPYHHEAPDPREPLVSMDASLNAAGRARFLLPEIAIDDSRPRTIYLEATVTDASGLTTQGNASFMLHPAELYAGIRAPRFVPMGRDFTVELRAATWDDQPVDEAQLRLRATRVLSNGSTEDIWEKELLIGNPSGQPFNISLEKSGSYHLSVIITDELGRENVSTTLVHVPGPDMEWFSQRPSGGLELMPDKESYQPGDVALLVIQNPYKEAWALLTVERRGVRSYQVVRVEGQAPSVEVPLADDDAPYVYASVTLVQGRIAPPPALPDMPDISEAGEESGGHDLASPRAAHGTVLLLVDDRRDPGLNVQAEADQEEYRPGAEARVTVRVTDKAGEARQSQITLLAVDDRILRAAGEQLRYDPAQTFARIFSYGMVNADIRQSLLNLSPVLMKEMAQYSRMGSPSAPMASMGMMDEGVTENALKATGGGAAGTQEHIRQNFDPMAFWLAEGESGPDGTLEASFTWPDTLTSYRIVAIATDKTTHFSLAEASARVNKPLQVLSALPRFVTMGDKLEGRILVQNTGSVGGRVTVEAEGENLSLGSTRQSIDLKAGESGIVTFPMSFEQAGRATLTVRATMPIKEGPANEGTERDMAQFSFPVMIPGPLTTVAAAGLLKQGEEFTLPIAPPHPLDPRSSLGVIFAASPAAGLPLTAQELIAYPWGCLEQRLSRAWLRSLRVQYGELIGLPEAPDDLQVIKESLASVSKFQVSDGGFNLWPGMRESSFYATVYALLVNSQMEALKLSMDRDAKGRAMSYISKQLNSAFAGRKESDWPAETAALALWLISREKPREAANLFPQMLEHFEQSPNVNPLAWATLLLTAAELETDLDARSARIITALEKTANVTPTQMHFATVRQGYYWMTMGSQLRDNAAVLAALTKVRPDYPRLEALAHWVSQGLGEKKSLSTQEAMYGIWGLASYLQSLGGNQPVSLKAAWGDDVVVKSFSRLIDAPQSWQIPAGQLENVLRAEKSDVSGLLLTAVQGNPYWTARLRYASPSAPLKPENAGFTITRSWISENTDSGDSPTWNVGDIVEVQISLTVPATRRHVLLFDPFPAGLEPLYASRVDIHNENQEYQYPWQFQESREDGMLLYAGVIHPGTYTYTYSLRAAAPGTFVQRPSYVEEMYTPEVFGRTTGDTVIVKP